jgi:SAM-dependent methyltransferase
MPLATDDRRFEARISCPVCDNGATTRIYSAAYDAEPVRSLIQSSYQRQGVIDWEILSGVPFEVDHCSVCDLIFQVQRPNSAMMEEIYTKFIGASFLEEVERSFLTLDQFHRIAGELTVLFEMIGKHPADIKVLDFGMGHGRWARVARGMGASVYVTEIGEEKRALAGKLGLEMIDDGDIDSMSFDIIHTEQVLEHLALPGRDFARLARALAPGGVFKAAVPYRGKLAELLATKGMPTVSMFAAGGAKTIPGEAEAFSSIQPLEHLNAFSPRTIGWLAERNGLKTVSAVRRRSVMVDTWGATGLLRGARKIGVELAKATIRPSIGYHLLRRA